MPNQLDRSMYEGGRPNRLARFLNGIWRRVGAAGLPGRYLELAPGARPHVPVDPGAPIEEFERVAPHYPVFRIRPR